MVIIIFIEPNATATVTPGLFTKNECTTSTIQVVPTPMAEAPADSQVSPMASPMATVEIGATIRTPNVTQIKTLIR